MAVKIQIRRDTSTNWATVNPILAQGEVGVELDTKKTKIGDGVKTWNQLDYWVGPITSTDVTTALGYTPYDSSNPAGYTNNIGTVTSVNNVQPVNGNVTIEIPDTATWGNITGDIADQTDLNTALGDKVDKTTTANKVYGTDANGDQTTYDKNSFGQVDDVTVGGTSVVANKVAVLGSMAGETASNYSTTTVANTLYAAKSLESTVSGIEAKIPSDATAQNQLADKDFVNSSIATQTANFIGTFDNESSLEAYTGTVTNNDYAFVINSVVTDNGSDWATFADLDAYSKTHLTNMDYAWVVNGSNFDLYRFDIVNQVWELRATAITKESVSLNTAYNRYKAVVSGSTVTWTYEYTLNNSSFTAEQWASINSGITSSDVALINTALQPNDDISELNNDAGYITNSDIPVTDVQINSTSILSGGVANIPTASSSDFGVIKVNGTSYGIGITNSTKEIYINHPTNAQIDSKSSPYFAVTMDRLDYAVKVGVTTNANALTDTEKQNACNWLGVEKGTTIQNLSATDSITLADNTIYNGGEQTALTITLPSTVDVSFLCEIDFTSSTSPTTLSYPNTVKWAGDDVNNNVFLPVASKRYTIICAYDGVNWRFTVKGVE